MKSITKNIGKFISKYVGNIFQYYIVRRFLFFILIIWLASTAIFLIPRLSGQDPVKEKLLLEAQRGGHMQSGLEEMAKAYQKKFGLDKPLIVQYGNYMKDLIRFDFGPSIAYFPKSVNSLIGDSVIWTLGLLSVVTFIAFFAGTLAGALLGWPRSPGFLQYIFMPILTLAANMWDNVDKKDRNLFLVHALSQISRRTSGSSRPYRAAFPKNGQDHDLQTLKRWFRYFVDKRHNGAAERILLTLNDRGYPKSTIADFVFAAATDYYFTGDGHAVDFANKMFEALDYVEWKGAHELLRPIIIDLTSRTRHEETSRWADAVPVLEPIFTRLDEIWQENQSNQSELDISAFTNTLLGDDFVPVVAEIETKLRKGVEPTDVCRAMTYASAIRTARFHLKNEGDWHDVANIYSYSHGLYRAFQYAPSKELLRGIFHGAVFLCYLRWLNMPSARIPKRGQRLDETFNTPKQMLNRLQEFADFQKVYEAEILVNQYLEEGHDVKTLQNTLAHILLREDAELHMFQVLEVAYQHFDITSDDEEKRMHLLAATRYITAQKLMKNILWSTENAERLARGELLSERDDDD